jgi:hypothetical protein
VGSVVIFVNWFAKHLGTCFHAFSIRALEKDRSGQWDPVFADGGPAMLRLNGQRQGCRKFAIRFEATPRIPATADVCRHGGGLQPDLAAPPAQGRGGGSRRSK